MLIVFQNPFADLRDFFPNASRLKRPNWSSLKLKSDFIHRFGVIEKRSISSKRKDWTNEELYCKANKAFRFNEESITNLAKHKHGLVVRGRRLYPLEVREISKDPETNLGIYYKNKTVGSFEVGFIHANKKNLLNNPMSCNDLTNLIKRCLTLPININLPNGNLKEDILLNINSYLNHIYLHATTKKSDENNICNWWVSCGDPILIVEYSTSEMPQPLKNSYLVKDLKEHHMRLFFKDLKVSNNRQVKTWYIETTKKTNPQKSKQLIEGLLHINKSQQCLNRVIANEDKLLFLNNPYYKDKFQKYLEFTFASLFKRNRFGFPCKEFATILQECEDVISSEERKLLITKYHKLGIRGNHLHNLEEFIKISKGAKSENTFNEGTTLMKEEKALNNKVDILIITAVKDEFDTIIEVEPDWVKKEDFKGYSYYTKQMFSNKGQPITMALAKPVYMGGIQTTNTATRLSNFLQPSCLAMVGICAGWRDKTKLGDVIVADKVFNYDSGKIIDFSNGKIQENEFFSDTTTYNLNALWKQRAEDFSYNWQKHIQTSRPVEHSYQEMWLLNALYEFSYENGENPTKNPHLKVHCPDYQTIIKNLEKKKLVNIRDLSLTKKGISDIVTLRNIYIDGLPKCSNESKVHVKPIATGNSVRQDPAIFHKISKNVRNVLGLEMEGSAIGEVAHLELISKFIVVKAISDYADEEKADYFRKYSIEAAYRFLIAFLKENFY